MGFATARVEPGDEVVQFAKTATSIVLRKSREMYDIVGRALVMPLEGPSHPTEVESWVPEEGSGIHVVFTQGWQTLYWQPLRQSLSTMTSG
jgi:hypothetical protein